MVEYPIKIEQKKNIAKIALVLGTFNFFCNFLSLN